MIYRVGSHENCGAVLPDITLVLPDITLVLVRTTLNTGSPRRTHFKNHQLISTLVLMRTAPQFSQKLPGKVAVLLRTAARFSQKHFFKNHPSVVKFHKLAKPANYM